mmetsp:Transcript_31562/g.65611  ORF Transcript_31562/g.65611 Transcript_31562/m.65611 type:complete len:413 (+) Transcript_31562:131-1369(+)
MSNDKTSDSSKKRKGLPRRLSPEDVSDLFYRIDGATAEARAELHHAKPIVDEAGLTLESSILDTTFGRPPPPIHCGPSSATDDIIDTADGTINRYGNKKNGKMNTNKSSTEYVGPKEAALACLRERQTYNPLRGTLSAFPFVLSTTGGYSNTDHIIKYDPVTGEIDKLSEYKRKYKRRVRQANMDELNIATSYSNSTNNNANGSNGHSNGRKNTITTYKWDLPRIPGGRRRRIKRDTDSPTAPPRPPEQGYLIFVSQMTTKLRHDNPDRHHDQISAIRRISPMWHSMSEEERGHYNDLARDAKEEYAELLREYRATGSYGPFRCIEKVRDKKKSGEDEKEDVTVEEEHRNSLGPWVRIPYERKNALEKEIDTYDVVCFPPRPPEMNEDYERRMKESRARRRRKIREEGLKYY